MDNLLTDIRRSVPEARAGWANDGSPERLPCVLLMEITRSSSVFGDNNPVAFRQTVEAHVYAEESERCRAIADTVRALTERRGFRLLSLQEKADGKARVVVVTFERWLSTDARDDMASPDTGADQTPRCDWL